MQLASSQPSSAAAPSSLTPSPLCRMHLPIPYTASHSQWRLCMRQLPSLSGHHRHRTRATHVTRCYLMPGSRVFMDCCLSDTNPVNTFVIVRRHCRVGRQFAKRPDISLPLDRHTTWTNSNRSRSFSFLSIVHPGPSHVVHRKNTHRSILRSHPTWCVSSPSLTALMLTLTCSRFLDLRM